MRYWKHHLVLFFLNVVVWGAIFVLGDDLDGKCNQAKLFGAMAPGQPVVIAATKRP